MLNYILLKAKLYALEFNMKKIGMFCSVLLLFACANNQKTENEAQTPVVTSYFPCSYSCGTIDTPCYDNGVKKPRVTEIMPKKRPCCDDEYKDAKTIVPDSPEIYVISANRTLRSMLEKNAVLFKNKTKVFVADTVNNEADMPGGIEKGTDVLKRGLKNIENIEVVSDREQADYVLTSEVSWFDTVGKTIPAIKYSLGLFNNHGQKLGEWNEILHQTNGDRSWW